jgi:hypothetical protein
MKARNDYGVVAAWLAVIGLLLMALFFIKGPLG